MRCIGIDPSLTRTGLAIIDGDTVTTASIKHVSYGTLRTQYGIVSEITKELSKGDLVVIESIGMPGRSGSSRKYVERIELCGMLKLAVRMRTGYFPLSCHPGTLKVFITGNGKAKKPEIVDSVRTIWGYESVRNHDEADALGLALIGESLVLTSSMQAIAHSEVASHASVTFKNQNSEALSFRLFADPSFKISLEH